MRKLALAVCLALACTPSIAQDKKEAQKEPTAAQKKQQERMKSCNDQAGAKKMEGDTRKKFMSACLKGEEKMTPQQARMKDCNKQASDKQMKGDDRKKFMSACLKG
jgi:psiF repeat